MTQLRSGKLKAEKEIRRYDRELFQAVEEGRTNSARRLFVLGADIECPLGIFQKTPLMEAISGKHWETARLLLEQGANVNAISEYRDTPLSIAVQVAAPDFITLLLEKGGIVNSRHTTGSTPLMMASAVGNVAAMSLLLEWGADINARDNKDLTPLMWAVLQNQKNAVKLLLVKGADVAAQTSHQGALYFARIRHFDEIADLVKKFGAQE